MRTETISDKLANIEKEYREKADRLRREGEILAELPQDIPAPCVYNTEGKIYGGADAWLSFGIPYGSTITGVDILDAIEAHGLRPLSATLCRYGNYRRSVFVGHQDEMAETKDGFFGSKDTLTDSDPIAPVYIIPCQHTGNSAHCYYQTPAGKIVEVKVELPRSLCGIHARRVERLGGWRFEWGTARLIYPKHWHSVEDLAGTAVANISQHSNAYVDTEQGVSGAIYFMPLTEQDKFPLSPAQMLRVLVSNQ